MKLYLVRHGQSVGNEQRLFFGHRDHPLTDLGREQARQAGEKLRDIPFSYCLTSDLLRAWETAKICIEGRDIPLETTTDLREQDMGEMEDTTWDQAVQAHGDLVMRLVEDWFHTPPPGGESVEEMSARVGQVLEQVKERGEDALLVAHNGSLTLILRLLGLAEESQLMRQGWFFHHGCYTEISLEGEKATLVGFNL